MSHRDTSNFFFLYIYIFLCNVEINVLNAKYLIATLRRYKLLSLALIISVDHASVSSSWYTPVNEYHSEEIDTKENMKERSLFTFSAWLSMFLFCFANAWHDLVFRPRKKLMN